MKKIILTSLLFSLIAMSGFSQSLDSGNESASVNYDYLNTQFNASNYSVAEDNLKTFRENSIGLMFMPIPLFIDQIEIDDVSFNNDENIFGTGIGFTANFDFNKRGLGFGAFMYYSFISGKEELKAEDFFAALKYDIRLGGLNSNFELSPLIGLGSLRFNVDEGNLGSSLYISGGARMTYRISNRFFCGADIITVPSIFDTEGLLGLDDGQEAEIDYKFIAQFNLSLRYNIFLAKDQN